MKMKIHVFLAVEEQQGEIDIGVGQFSRHCTILDVFQWTASQEPLLESLDLENDLLLGAKEEDFSLVCPPTAQVTTCSPSFLRSAVDRKVIQMKVYLPESSLFTKIQRKRDPSSSTPSPSSSPFLQAYPSSSSTSSLNPPTFTQSSPVSPRSPRGSCTVSPVRRNKSPKTKRKVAITSSESQIGSKPQIGSDTVSEDGENKQAPSIGAFDPGHSNSPVQSTSPSLGRLVPPRKSSSKTSPRRLSATSSFSSFSKRMRGNNADSGSSSGSHLDLGEEEEEEETESEEEEEEEKEENLSHLLREKSEAAHDFRLVTFRKPTNCEVCKDLLWGLKNQGYKCRLCGLKVHRGCRQTAPECEGTIKRTSSFTPDMSRVQQLCDYAATTDIGTLSRNLSSLTAADLTALKDTYPLYHRTSVEIELNKYNEPLTCYHDLFNIPSPLQEIERLKSCLRTSGAAGFSSSFQVTQKTKEIQDIVSFRCQISSMFRKFNPNEIPEMTASFVPRKPTPNDQTKVINIQFFFGETQFSDNMTSKLRLCDPLRIAVKKAISVSGKSCPVQSVDDAVLRRVGRKEYIWQLENAAVCYDFAIEAFEQRGILKFFVTSKEKMTADGVVFDEDAAFEKGARARLSRTIENFWLPDDAEVKAVNKQYGMDLARREKVHNSKDIDKKFSLQIKTILNFRELEKTLVPEKWKTEEDIYMLATKDQKYKNFERSWVYFVEVVIYNGNTAITPRLYSIPIKSIVWPVDEVGVSTIQTDLSYKDIPPQSRVCLTLFCGQPKNSSGKLSNFLFGNKDEENTCITLGSVALSITEYNGYFRQGEQHAPLWPKRASNPADSILSNPDPEAMKLSIEFPSFNRPVVAFDRIDPKTVEKNQRISEQSLPSYKRRQIQALFGYDIFSPIPEDNAKKIWKNRFSAREMFPEHLSKIILSAPKEEEDEIRELVDPELGLHPCQVPPSVALELLEYKFGNKYVRRFAVQCLAKCSDSEILLWMLQLVQALKYEPRHYSCLSYFLIFKALHSKKLGFSFFWMLVAEISSNKEEELCGENSLYLTPSSSQRFLLYIDAYLNFCGEDIRKSLIDQLKLMDNFSRMAEAIQQQKSAGNFEQLKKERNLNLRDMLTKSKFPDLFSLPTDSDCNLASVLVDKCKVMVSAAAPLWLTFASEEIDASPFFVIFKKGDDLRKDILSLQMFRLFDHIWKQGNLDLRMTPYQVVMTGRETGLVQVVKNSRTCADIQKEEAGVRGAFKTTGLLRWLEEKNPTKGNLEQAIDNFICSCAAYCVATYVLGVGDRHNDNIMVTETGLFFHIDFGYILGDFLKFGIIDRESAPFVLTKEFVKTMGGEDSKGFKRFQDLCVTAYQLLRENSSLIISLFTMMLGCGIPGVSRLEDLYFLRTSLALEMSEKESRSHFSKLIEKSHRSMRTQFNFAAHILAN